MYKNNLEVKNNKVYINVDIPNNSPIYEFTGALSDKIKHDKSLVLQIGHDLYMGPSGELDDIINHSCSPNCYINIVGKRAILYSLFPIKAGSEITFDYSLSSTDTYESWTMNCNCKSYKCRKVISGFQYLDEDMKETYIKKGIVPLFINDKRFK